MRHLITLLCLTVSAESMEFFGTGRCLSSSGDLNGCDFYVPSLSECHTYCINWADCVGAEYYTNTRCIMWTTNYVDHSIDGLTPVHQCWLSDGSRNGRTISTTNPSQPTNCYVKSSPPSQPPLPPPPSPPPPAPPEDPTSSGNSDPHIVFANGAKADFRGSNNGIYNFISYPKFSANVRIQSSLFKYKNITVDGTFMTEFFVTATTTNGKHVKYSHSALRANNQNWGWKMSNGTCDDKLFYTFPHFTFKCDDFKAKVDASSTYISYKNWNIRVQTNNVYGYIKGANKRIDIQIKSQMNLYSHGIMGQGFNKNMKVMNGKKDTYPDHGYFKTEAQLEGSIQGTYKEYEMSYSYDTDFKYSKFRDKTCVQINYNDTQLFSETL